MSSATRPGLGIITLIGLTILLGAYFTFAAVQGDYGLFRRVQIKAEAEALRSEAAGPIPVDAVTTSASGLDPHISPAYAARQVARIAAARKAQPAEVLAVIAANTEGSTFGLLGEPRVNVLAVNLALDARWPRAQR